MRLRVGVHVSVAGGLLEALHRATERGCDAFQIFSSNPRTWHRPLIHDRADADFRALRSELGLEPLVIHTIYLMNLASADPVLRERSIEALALALRRAAALGAEYVVTHLGSAKKAAAGNPVMMAEAVRRTASAIMTGFHRFFASPDAAGGAAPTLLLENSAGAGGSIGSSFAQIAKIIEILETSPTGSPSVVPLGLCLDTCHSHAKGYDLSTEEGRKELFREIESLVGLERIKLVHGNDSKGPAGSRLDRHEHIGEGTIGEASFGKLLTESPLADLPWILETPGTLEDDLRNIAAVRRLARRTER